MTRYFIDTSNNQIRLLDYNSNLNNEDYSRYQVIKIDNEEFLIVKIETSSSLDSKFLKKLGLTTNEDCMFYFLNKIEYLTQITDLYINYAYFKNQVISAFNKELKENFKFYGTMDSVIIQCSVVFDDFKIIPNHYKEKLISLFKEKGYNLVFQPNFVNKMSIIIKATIIEKLLFISPCSARPIRAVVKLPGPTNIGKAIGITACFIWSSGVNCFSDTLFFCGENIRFLIAIRIRINPPAIFNSFIFIL